MSNDAEHAEIIRQNVERLNKVILDATRTGLEVELKVKTESAFGLPANRPTLKYLVWRTVKRG